jgi:hypothetical protein
VTGAARLTPQEMKTPDVAEIGNRRHESAKNSLLRYGLLLALDRAAFNG